MHSRIRVARTTGIFYLAMAFVGAIGFLLIRPQLHVPDDPIATLTRLVERDGLARLAIALELATVVVQALLALSFFRLFRAVDSFMAGALAAFGMMNAVAIMGSAALVASARQVAHGSGLAPLGGDAQVAQLLYTISANFWDVGGLFFGLWLLPMGWLILRSGWMPRPLGWVLFVGGVGYVLSSFVTYLLPDATLLIDGLPLLATVGEFWILGYLIIVGVRPSAVDTNPWREGQALK
ncbi:MAG: DUF4386 domain-containing protein [Trueperaceae bacterium]|nr:DUF4386 domain-containing protein [Trueperaceae bacterium]